MIINIFPVTVFAEEEQSLEEIIRPQVEAFAKSIDQKNADGAAQDALISHGMFGNGKKLSVGKNHAITATLMNSELVKEAIPNFLATLLNARKEYCTDEIYGCFGTNWSVSGKREYYILLYDYDYRSKFRYDSEGNWFGPSDYLNKPCEKISVEKANGYDNTLILIVGGMGSQIDAKVSKVYDDRIVYDVSVLFHDVFNFDTENDSALENLLGWVGMLLFEPFEWESKFNFQIEVPIEKPKENAVFGDSDGNGSVDVMDAYFARLVAAKLVVPTEEQLAFCDVDSDGKITAIDANIIRKFAAGIIKELPVS